MQTTTSSPSPLKDRVLLALSNHSTSSHHFGKNIWDHLELVSVQVRESEGGQGWTNTQTGGDLHGDVSAGKDENGRKKRRDARVVVETVVQQDWLNPVGVLHGAATAYLVDVCSSLPLIALSTSDFWPGLGGLSASLNLVYHAACPRGTRIRIDSRTTNVGRSIANMRCEIRDTKTSRLYASGTHTKVDAFATRELAKKRDEQQSASAGGRESDDSQETGAKARL